MDYVASAVMVKNVKTVPSTMTLPQLEEAFLRDRVSGYAVTQDGKLVGVVTRSDLLHTLKHNHALIDSDYIADDTIEAGGTEQLIPPTLGDRTHNLHVQDIMTSQVVAVRPNDHLHDVADTMYQNRIHRVFVVENDELKGVITPFDFVRLYSTDRIGAEGQPRHTMDF